MKLIMLGPIVATIGAGLFTALWLATKNKKLLALVVVFVLISVALWLPVTLIAAGVLPMPVIKPR